MAARDSVVLLRSADGSLGTGFVFGDTKTIATAAHVPASIAVDRHGGVYTLRRIAADHPHDVALYQLDRPVEDATPLRAGHADIGLAVFSIGHPNGGDALFPGLYRWSVIHGMVSGVTADWVLTSFVPGPGGSGGPLVTCDGTVVGVLRGYDPPTLYTRFANVVSLTQLYTTRRSVPSPGTPNRLVADIALDLDIFNDQIGAEVGIAWVGEAIWGASLTSALSTNTFAGDLRQDGRVNLFRLSLDVLATLDSIEFAVGTGWKRRWSSPLVVTGPTQIDDYLVPRIGVRYYSGGASSGLFVALQAEAEIGDGVEPSVWLQFGYRLGQL